MYHRLWMTVNILILIITTIYVGFLRPHDNSFILLGQLIAQLGMILFLVNVNMYFIFLVIKKTPQRNVKISLAKWSRHLMKWHIPIAASGTILILIHAGIMFKQLAPLVGYGHLKLITGYFALLELFITLFAGYLRHNRASGFRRKFHLTMAMIFSLTLIGHIFLYI